SDRFRVVALAAGRNVEKLAEQVKRFEPALVAVIDESRARELRERLAAGGTAVPQIQVGAGGLEAVATHDADLVVAALVGAVGLRPTLAAIEAGRDVALAHKEVLVMAGALVLRAVQARGVALLPVDSEHSAIFQALSGQRAEDVARIVLTCSGGPFRTWTADRMAKATVEEALAHPNWDMGQKVTIDSATLMNKGLEVIEAHWLFDLKPAEIQVVIHPQSIIHSMVEFADGSIKAQLGVPDMCIPIQYALTYPKRLSADFPRLDFRTLKELTFEQPNFEKFRCLKLAYEALETGGAAPAVLNAANEEAVDLFLTRKIGFEKIPQIVEKALTNCKFNSCDKVEDLLQYDKLTREYVLNGLN
ncbi:1-deoxy-D-xylulose-5-phosphate reductoisomerase, partial [candidate division KSB1 bacterium]|nr:1-deoxy-D-xylulose-5-phosphate reductoisomerase [candidate division KSB1 bacterium]